MYVGHSVREYGSETKQVYRNWLVEKVSELTGWSRIPACQSYFTLQGHLTDGEQLLDGVEPIQLVRRGFIEPHQYHGVEVNPTTYRENQRLLIRYPDAHLYYGSIEAVAERLAAAGAFQPGVVALDTSSEPNYAARILAGIAPSLRQTPNLQKVVFVNVVLRDRYRTHSIASLSRALHGQDAIHTMLAYDGWCLGPTGLRYRGVDRKTTMFTFYLHYKPKRKTRGS